MSINLSSLDLTREAIDLDIVDKHNEKTGLSLKIRPKTADEYQAAVRKMQDRLSSGKKLSVKERRAMNDSLLIARIGGWSWTGKAREAAGEPEFNTANLKDVLFENGKHSAAIREQVNEVVGSEDELFIEED